MKPKFASIHQTEEKEHFIERGSPIQNHNVTPTRKFGGGSIMVWGCFLSCGVGYLCRIDGGVDSDMYIKILNDDLMETIKWYGLNKKEIIFQQDNASCHKAKSVMEWFNTNKIKVLPWSPQSPDLNPIEHLWDQLKRKIYEKNSPQTLDELWIKCEEVWNEITHARCSKLVYSMENRVKEVLKSRGGYTTY